MAGKNTDIYKCSSNECAGDGKRMGEMYLRCDRCEMKYYIQCVLFEEEDVFALIKSIGLITTQEKQDEKTKEMTTETATNITERTRDTYETIMGDGTSFKYTCKQCLKKGNTKEIIKALKSKLNKTENELKTTKKQLREETEKNKTMDIELNTKNKLIEDLTERMEAPHTLTEGGRESNRTQNDITQNDRQQEETEQLVNTTIKNYIEIQINKINDTCKETITNECKRMKEKIMSELRTENNTNTYTEENMDRAEGSKENEKKNTNKMKQRTLTSMLQHTQKTVTFDGGEISDEEGETNEQRHTSNIHFNENLKPAPERKQYNEKNKYEIYVAKFPCGTKCQDIEQHIMQNTSTISNESFKIEEIYTKKQTQPSYVAFKITTLRKNLYNEIMNIWTPHYKAREYRQRETTTTQHYTAREYKQRETKPYETHYYKANTQRRGNRYESRYETKRAANRTPYNEQRREKPTRYTNKYTHEYRMTPKMSETRNNYNSYSNRIVETPKRHEYEARAQTQYIYIPVQPQTAQFPQQYTNMNMNMNTQGTMPQLTTQNNFLGQQNRMNGTSTQNENL